MSASHVASLELCKQLYELSGWRDTEYTYWNDVAHRDISDETLDWGYEYYKDNCFPAYSLGYLLRKLPEWTDWSLQPNPGAGYSIWLNDTEGNSHRADGDTPEDATAKFVVGLFKSGVLVRAAS